MMLLLSEMEARELDTALSIYLKELENEVLHTDMRDYKRDLKDRFAHLEMVKQRLARLVEQEPVLA